jgi:hypothetical protein
MIGKDGECFLEVILLKDGPWSTKSVFTGRYMCDIVSVEGVLGSDSTLDW